MLRLLASIKVTRTWKSSKEDTTHLSDVTRVSGSSQHLLDDGVLDFVLLQKALGIQLDCECNEGNTMCILHEGMLSYHCNSLTE